MRCGILVGLVVGIMAAACGSHSTGSSASPSTADNGTTTTDNGTTTTLMDREPPVAVAELMNEYAGRLLSAGEVDGTIHVDVAADEESLAVELDQRPGITVDRVGALAWPIDSAVAVCEPSPDLSESSPINGLVFEVLTPDKSMNASGTDPEKLVLHVSNTSSREISFNTAAADALLLGRSGNVVNANTFGLGSVWIPVVLAPGAAEELDVFVSTASCDPALGYEVPPGEYGLVAEVQVNQERFHTAPVSVTVG